MDNTRLIESTFPLKQASLDSVHEKNVRHGHISTLHIWPARRPLAACRAALIATLLPDPGNAEERKKLLEKLAGTVVEVMKKKKLPSGKVEEKKVEETVGGILHWGRESGPDLEWFRQKIREAYGGQAPKVLDPFAGVGTTLVQSYLHGFTVVGFEINPYAALASRMKLESADAPPPAYGKQKSRSRACRRGREMTSQGDPLTTASPPRKFCAGRDRL